MAVGILELIFIMMFIFGRGAWSVLPQADTFCGDLAEADCTTLQDSYDATNALTSYRFSGVSTITVETPGEVPENVTFNITMAGGVAGDMRQLNSLDPTISLDNAVTVLDAYSTALNSTRMTMNMNLHIDEAAAEEGITDFPLQMRMLAGILYLYSDAPTANMPNWVGLDYSGISSIYQGMLTSAIRSEEVSAEQLAQIATLLQGDYFQLNTDPAFMGDYITVTRGEDVMLDGLSLVAITTTADLNKLYSNAQFIAATRTLVEQLVAIDPTLGDGESVDTMVEQMTTGLSSAYGNTTYSVTVWINPADALVHHAELSVDMTITSGTLFGADKEGSTTTEATDSLHMVITTTLDYSHFNQPVEVEVPENAEITDITELYGDF